MNARFLWWLIPIGRRAGDIYPGAERKEGGKWWKSDTVGGGGDRWPWADMQTNKQLTELEDTPLDRLPRIDRSTSASFLQLEQKESIVSLLIGPVLTLINHGLQRMLTLSNEDSVLQQHIRMLLLCQRSVLIIAAGPLICWMSWKHDDLLSDMYWF